MPRTLEELAQLLEQSAGESAKTNAKIDSEVLPRLDRIDETVKAAGLNGHTSLLRKFLDEYAAGQSLDQAKSQVWAHYAARFHFLSQPKSWLKALFYAAIGGLGWKLVSGLTLPHFPH